MKKLYGVITAMLTPFDDNGAVDVEAIKKMTEFYISKGVHCLYPCGTTGEMYLLSEDERKTVAETVIRQAANRATVFIHTGAMTLRETIALTQHAQRTGADGVGVVTPSYFGITEREMEEYFVAVANSVPADFPVYLYNIPQLSGNDLKPATIEKIVKRCPNVCGIKYSYADMLRVNEYLRVNNGSFSVVVGADRLFLPALAMGCDGLVSGVSSVCPEPFVSLYNAWTAGDQETAKKLYPIGADVSNTLCNGANMAIFKAALSYRGIPAGHMRKPLLDLPEDEKKVYCSNLQKFIDLLGL